MPSFAIIGLLTIAVHGEAVAALELHHRSAGVLAEDAVGIDAEPERAVERLLQG